MFKIKVILRGSDPAKDETKHRIETHTLNTGWSDRRITGRRTEIRNINSINYLKHLHIVIFWK